MLRASLLLLAFLSLAQAQPTRSPVFAALAPAAVVAAPLADLIRTFDAPARQIALEALDRLDRAPLSAADLAELSEAYRLLGRPEKAVESARLIAAKDDTPEASVRAIAAMAQAGDYKSAVTAAEVALGRRPNDPDLRAAYHQVKNRGTAVRIAPAPAAAALPARGDVDARPVVLAVKVPKASVEVPSVIDEPVSAGYVPWGARRLTWRDRLVQRSHLLYALAFPSRSEADVRELARLRGTLDGSESGRALVGRLGGWEEIDKRVDVRLATLPRGTYGYAVSLPAPDEKGRRSVLLVSRAVLKESDAVGASVLAHELSHVSDYRDGYAKTGLSIPSDYAAHRVQARTFLELAGKEKNPVHGYMWDYSRFLSDLWVDRITARFPSAEAFRKSYSNGLVGGMAEQAYQDLAEGKVRPGSEHVDHHLTAPDRGMYTLLTDQKDIVDSVRRKKERGESPTPEEEAALRLREKMIARMNTEDAAYRRAHGYE